jgi:hypothetical protein
MTPRTVARVLACAVTLLGAALIVDTYHVFSQTYDEPSQIAAGMQWLSDGVYTYEPQHPPLGRIAAAIGPYLAGSRTLPGHDMYYEGQLLLGSGAHYRRTLALARLGELPFFLAICAVVWLWGRRLFGGDERDAPAAWAGALAVLFVATNPNILAHSALATTDIAPALMVVATLYAYARWTARPTIGESLLFGLCVGLNVVSKFSAVAFLGVALVLAEAWRVVSVRAGRTPRRPAMREFISLAAVVFLAAALVIWATYRFAVGPIGRTGIAGPAPALFQGFADFFNHGTSGHPAFLLGHTSDTGWWYYFPVALLVKTPLPLFVLGLVGAATTVRAMWTERAFEPALPLIGVVAVLVLALMVKVDIGIRHVLPLYPLLALLAARGTLDLWRLAAAAGRASAPFRRTARGAVVALAASALYVVGRAHPDHLAYFNPLAGAHPEHVLVDSNLDWGQDVYRLEGVRRALHIDSLSVAFFGTTDLHAAGLQHARRLLPNERATGWVAASQTLLQGEWVGGAYSWLFRYRQVGRVGKSLVLFWVPEAD